MPEAEQTEIVEQELHTQQELFRMDEFMDLERRRIDSIDKRTEVARAYVDANNEADQRRYNYHIHKLSSDKEERKETRRATIRIFWALSGISASFMLILFYMVFFGDSEQTENAMTLLKVLGTGLGGFGIGYLALSVIRRLIGKL